MQIKSLPSIFWSQILITLTISEKHPFGVSEFRAALREASFYSVNWEGEAGFIPTTLDRPLPKKLAHSICYLQFSIQIAQLQTALWQKIWIFWGKIVWKILMLLWLTHFERMLATEYVGKCYFFFCNCNHGCSFNFRKLKILWISSAESHHKDTFSKEWKLQDHIGLLMKICFRRKIPKYQTCRNIQY